MGAAGLGMTSRGGHGRAPVGLGTTSRAAEDETRPAGDARAAEDARPGTGRSGRGRTRGQGRRRWRGRDDEVRVGAGRCRVGAASRQRGGRGRRRCGRGRGRDEGGGGASDACRSEEGRSEGRRGPDLCIWGQSGKVSAGWPYQSALTCPMTSGWTG